MTVDTPGIVPVTSAIEYLDTVILRALQCVASYTDVGQKTC